MRLRRDALAGAAEWIGAVERFAARRAPLVATVGTIAVSPGAANVIAGEAVLGLDVRHPLDRARQAALRSLLGQGQTIARRRGLSFRWEKTQDDGAVACDRRLRRELARAAAPWSPPELASGAGHDAVVISQLTRVAMLFVRCRAGLSHHPSEYAAPRDIAAALGASCQFISSLARHVRT
jgi:allantoate deiminase